MGITSCAQCLDFIGDTRFRKECLRLSSAPARHNQRKRISNLGKLDALGLHGSNSFGTTMQEGFSHGRFVCTLNATWKHGPDQSKATLACHRI
jgi:hypothetical protein